MIVVIVEIAIPQLTQAELPREIFGDKCALGNVPPRTLGRN